MTPRQIFLVQKSFSEIVPSAGEVATLFYQRLFTLDPSVRPLFRTDLNRQGQKLMASLALIVNGLEHPQQIAAALRHLGQRHVGYGVQAQDYETVRAALLWALGQRLGATFTAEVEEAWAAAYSLMTDLMLQAAAEVSTARGL